MSIQSAGRGAKRGIKRSTRKIVHVLGKRLGPFFLLKHPGLLERMLLGAMKEIRSWWVFIIKRLHCVASYILSLFVCSM